MGLKLTRKVDFFLKKNSELYTDNIVQNSKIDISIEKEQEQQQQQEKKNNGQ